MLIKILKKKHIYLDFRFLCGDSSLSIRNKKVIHNFIKITQNEIFVFFSRLVNDFSFSLKFYFRTRKMYQKRVHIITSFTKICKIPFLLLNYIFTDCNIVILKVICYKIKKKL